MTPREYSNACDGYNNKKKIEYQTSWEQARWVATVIVNVNSAKKRYKPTDLIKFPWEEVDHTDEIEELKKQRNGGS